MAAPRLPEFTPGSLLPSGIYEFPSCKDIWTSRLVNDPIFSEIGKDRRIQLVGNLEKRLPYLFGAGVTELFIGGSFVEQIDCPSDIDGYFAVDQKRIISGELVRTLNAHDPEQCWGWELQRVRTFRGIYEYRTRLWIEHRLDLQPHYGQKWPVQKENGKVEEVDFPRFFSRQKFTDEPKGIIKIVRSK